MRTVSSSAQDYMQKQHGCEPMFIIGVQWIKDGPEVLYADQEVEGEGEQVRVQVVEISSFDTALKLSGSSDSQSVSVTLDDVDGSLKSLLDSTDIHNAICNVYQHFKGLPLPHKFLLFKGKVVTPIEWDEGARTFHFDVLTQLDEIEVGFSMEEGHFPRIPEDALGKVWPLVFGSVCNLQAVQVRSPRRGILTQGEGIVDFTLPHRICQAKRIQCPSVPAGEFTEWGTGEDGKVTSTQYQDYRPDRHCVDDRFNKICALADLLEQQESYEHNYLLVRGGESFPQGESVTIVADGVRFFGSFSGTIFNITGRVHPDYEEVWPEIVAHPCKAISNRGYGSPKWHYNENWKKNESKTTWYVEPTAFDLEDCDSEGSYSQTSTGGSSESLEYFDDMPTSSFVWLPAGTEVYLEDEAEILYIVSLIPGTVDNVSAYKTQPSGRALLTTVPADYYTVYETDYDGYQVVEIGMEKRLSQRDADWADDLYVSFTSDIGPNPVDIIIWLLNKYTNLTYDTITFNAVKTLLTNYPSNFFLKERMNVWQLIQDIAYQARCAVYVRANVVFIVYLSAEPTAVRTLTQDDIVAKSFRVVLTPTEEIATKHVIKWQNGEAGLESDDKIERIIVLKHNIQKYGIHEKEIKYYTQNTYDTILKSATFWMIKDANVWKKLEFETPLLHLDLDIFDCIEIDIPVFGATPLKVIIVNAQYQNSTNTVRFECMTPVKSGEIEPYDFFWPAAAQQLLIFPLEDEEQYSGAGYDFDVSPPIGHILAGGDTTDIGDRVIVMTSGDTHPSDLDDTYPTLECIESSFQEIEEEDPVFQAWQRARNTSYQQQDVASDTGAGGNGGSDQQKKKDRMACQQPMYGYGCLYEVTVIYITSELVTYRVCKGGPCGYGVGMPCTGPVHAFCHTFGAYFAAAMFYIQKYYEIQALKAGCGSYATGTTLPYGLGWVKVGVTSDTGLEDCEMSWPGDENAPQVNAGEIFAPKEHS